MLSYIASVLLVVRPRQHVERLVCLYNDVKTIRRSGLNEDTINDRHMPLLSDPVALQTRILNHR